MQCSGSDHVEALQKCKEVGTGACGVLKEKVSNGRVGGMASEVCGAQNAGGSSFLPYPLIL